MQQLKGFKGLISKASKVEDADGKTVTTQAGALETALASVNLVLGIKDLTKVSNKKQERALNIAVEKANAAQAKTPSKPVKVKSVQELTEDLMIAKDYLNTSISNSHPKARQETCQKAVDKAQKKLNAATGVSDDVSDTRNLDGVRLLKTLIQACIDQVHKLGKEDKSWIENSLRASAAR